MICKTFPTFILWPLSKFLLIIKYAKGRPDLKTTFIHHWPSRMFCLVPKQWQIIYLRWTQNFLKNFYFWPLIEGGKKCKLFGGAMLHLQFSSSAFQVLLWDCFRIFRLSMSPQLFFIIHFTKFWGNNEFTCSKI